MRFSDRTISYDTGLNLMKPVKTGLIQIDVDEDEFVIMPHNGATVARKPAIKKISTDSGTDQTHDDGIGTSDDETNSNSSSTESKSEELSNSPNMAQSRRVIKLDLAAMSQLLAFDEEEEEDLVESEEDEIKPNGVNSSHNKAWRKTIAKDLAKLARNDKSQLRRRHSITLCESRHRKSSTDSNTSTESKTSQRTSPPKEFASLNVTAIEHCNNLTSTTDFQSDFDQAPKPLKTLDLRLEEVAHIRSVLTKVELEAMPIDSAVRDSISRGKICFHCMKTKFGLFYRGQCCEMCKQTFCTKCHTKMRIPVEHFSTIPVFALSPMNPIESQSKRIELDQSLAPINNNNNSRKISLPNGLAYNASVGSAPNSPKHSPKSSKDNLNGTGIDCCDDQQPSSLVPTISGFLTGAPPVSQNGPTSLPPFMLNNKYATLPTKTRRLSWMSARNAQREKLEGSLLTVCVDCKEMVVQVIRVSRSSKRHSRAEFSPFLRS